MSRYELMAGAVSLLHLLWCILLPVGFVLTAASMTGTPVVWPLYVWISTTFVTQWIYGGDCPLTLMERSFEARSKGQEPNKKHRIGMTPEMRIALTLIAVLAGNMLSFHMFTAAMHALN